MKALRTRLEKTVPQPPVLAMNKGFGGYAPEDEKTVRRPDVKPGLTRHILAAWNRFVKAPFDGDLYSAAVQEIRGVPKAGRTKEAVELFSMAAAELERGPEFEIRLGMFLSAVVNLGSDTDYVIHTHMLEHIICLAYRNTKNLTINGPAGGMTCNEMRKGQVTVNGCVADDACSHMDGGKVLIKGDAGNLLCEHMVGGKVTVEGSCGRETANRMKGGIVRVMGTIVGLSDIDGGKVYNGKKLLVSKRSVDATAYRRTMGDIDELNEYLRSTEGDADG